MECPVCLNRWNESTSIPYMLKCGHSFCQKCLTDLYKHEDKGINCPFCQNLQVMKSDQFLGELIKNYTLLSISSAQQYEDTLTKTPHQRNITPQQKSSPSKPYSKNVFNLPTGTTQGFRPKDKFQAQHKHESELKESHSVKVFRPLNQESIDFGKQLDSQVYCIQPLSNKKCQTHQNQSLNFYSFDKEGKAQFYCQVCIEQLHNVDEVKVDQSVYVQAKRKLRIAKESIIHKQIYLELLYKKVSDDFDEEQTKTEKSIIDIIAEIKLEIVRLEEELKAKSKSHLSKKRLQIDHIKKAIAKKLELLNKSQCDIGRLQSMNDVEFLQSIAEMVEINQRFSEDVNFLEAENFQCEDLIINTFEIKTFIENAFTQCFKNYVKITEKKPVQMDYKQNLSGDLQWMCTSCLTSNLQNQHQCVKCNKHRNLLTYDFFFYQSILENLMSLSNTDKFNESDLKIPQLSQDSLKHLTLRRKDFEKVVVHEREQKYLKSQKWYAISMKWMQKWMASIGGTSNESNTFLTSCTPKSDVYPGPIDNSDLYQVDENKSANASVEVLQLKQGLARNEDYKMVNDHVWSVLFALYGSGSVIVRSEKDIYSKLECRLDFEQPRQEDLKAQLEAFMDDQEPMVQEVNKISDFADKNRNIFQNSVLVQSNKLKDMNGQSPEDRRKSGVATSRNKQAEATNYNVQSMADKNLMKSIKLQCEKPQIQKRNLFGMNRTQHHGKDSNLASKNNSDDEFDVNEFGKEKHNDDNDDNPFSKASDYSCLKQHQNKNKATTSQIIKPVQGNFIKRQSTAIQSKQKLNPQSNQEEYKKAKQEAGIVEQYSSRNMRKNNANADQQESHGGNKKRDDSQPRTLIGNVVDSIGNMFGRKQQPPQ